MRKLLALLVLCLLWVTPISSQTKKDKDRDELAGPVKSVKASFIDFVRENNRIVEKNRPWHTITYNTEGNYTERFYYDHSGPITARYVHTYDANGRSTGYEEYPALLDKTLTIPRRHVYTLNNEGRRVQYIVYESNGSVGTRFVYKYDAKGNLIEEQWFTHTGQPGGRMVYTFDENGAQTSQTSYESDGTLGWKNISKYDSNGNKTESLQHREKTLRYKILYSYDSKGRILEAETFELNGAPRSFPSHDPQPGKVVYTYDDDKRTKEVSHYDVDGRLRVRGAYAYDERNNEVSLTVFHTDGSIKNGGPRLIKIEYDSYGNWTRKTYLARSDKNEQPQAFRAEVRVIAYY